MSAFRSSFQSPWKILISHQRFGFQPEAIQCDSVSHCHFLLHAYSSDKSCSSFINYSYCARPICQLQICLKIRAFSVLQITISTCPVCSSGRQLSSDKTALNWYNLLIIWCWGIWYTIIIVITEEMNVLFNKKKNHHAQTFWNCLQHLKLILHMLTPGGMKLPHF